jgi:2,3-bisphosphoglycerate-independent phosphoglycerate mutase
MPKSHFLKTFFQILLSVIIALQNNSNFALMKSNKALLVILDGWGINPDPTVSAIARANTPFVDSLWAKYPHSELITYGEDVGLPEGQMGNSEVGHLNIGAGRVVYQELVRINKAIKDIGRSCLCKGK